MELTTTIGLVAASCTTAALIPQVWQSLKSKDTSGLSRPMYIIFITGIGLWLLYGLLIHDLPLIAANTVTFLLAAIILFLKSKHG